MKLSYLAERFSCQLEGDGDIEISGVATLEEACEGQISFLTNNKYLQEAKTTNASAIILGLDGHLFQKATIKHENPYLIFAKILELFSPTPPRIPAIHPSAVISDSATIRHNVSIGASVFIGNGVSIGENTIIEPNVVILEGVKIGRNSHIMAGAILRQNVLIGDDCIIQSNAVIGSDGFGFAKQEDGTWYKIVQTGTVILEDKIEVGAGSMIDRASLGESRIRSGAKLDNLVQIGHGSSVGENTLLCAQVGLAGSTHIGKNVILAGQVGSAGHLKIGNNVIATGQTGIQGDIADHRIISGSPSFENKQWLKSTAIFSKLPELMKLVRNLERRIKKLETFK